MTDKPAEPESDILARCQELARRALSQAGFDAADVHVDVTGSEVLVWVGDVRRGDGGSAFYPACIDLGFRSDSDGTRGLAALEAALRVLAGEPTRPAFQPLSDEERRCVFEADALVHDFGAIMVDADTVLGLLAIIHRLTGKAGAP